MIHQTLTRHFLKPWKQLQKEENIVEISEQELRALLRSVCFIHFGELPFEQKYQLLYDELITLIRGHEQQAILQEFQLITEENDYKT